MKLYKPINNEFENEERKYIRNFSEQIEKSKQKFKKLIDEVKGTKKLEKQERDTDMRIQEVLEDFARSIIKINK